MIKLVYFLVVGQLIRNATGILRKKNISFQLSAKQNAEKRYHEVLKKEGLQEQDLVRLTKPMQKRRRVKTLSVPRKKSSREAIQ